MTTGVSSTSESTSIRGEEVRQRLTLAGFALAPPGAVGRAEQTRQHIQQKGNCGRQAMPLRSQQRSTRKVY